MSVGLRENLCVRDTEGGKICVWRERVGMGDLARGEVVEKLASSAKIY